MSRYDDAKAELVGKPRTWLVTGAAGFIGSHLAEALLSLGQEVVGIDNLVTGSPRNVEAIRSAGNRFRFMQADIRDPAAIREACAGAEVVLHQAALGSVPRSMADPLATTSANVDGTVAVFSAAAKEKVRRVVFASSSSVYGDDSGLPKREDRLGRPLSPYALSKRVGEEYAELFGRAFGLEAIGLRYFNVFGARQDPEGPYAAVIPRWFSALLSGAPVEVFGDGSASRDFCFVGNVVQANLLAACCEEPAVAGQIFNVACGQRTTLTELFEILRELAARHRSEARAAAFVKREGRAGDVPHSLADISKAKRILGYEPTHDVRRGLEEASEWYWRESGQ